MGEVLGDNWNTCSPYKGDGAASIRGSERLSNLPSGFLDFILGKLQNPWLCSRPLPSRVLQEHSQ